MQNIKAVVFDLYGTLYDVLSVRALCDEYYPGYGDTISKMWRQKQLEYTWLRSLMGQYKDFEQATADALRYTCSTLGLTLDLATSERLLNQYLRISPYPEVPAALEQMREMGLPLAILSNGSRNSIQQVVENAGMATTFDRLISVDEVEVFKPHTNVYQLAIDVMGLPKEEILFVSCNAWDATGAKYFGFPVCWINRSAAPFEEMGQQPDFIAKNIQHLTDQIVEAKRKLDQTTVA